MSPLATILLAAFLVLGVASAQDEGRPSPDSGRAERVAPLGPDTVMGRLYEALEDDPRTAAELERFLRDRGYFELNPGGRAALDEADRGRVIAMARSQRTRELLAAAALEDLRIASETYRVRLQAAPESARVYDAVVVGASVYDQIVQNLLAESARTGGPQLRVLTLEAGSFVASTFSRAGYTGRVNSSTGPSRPGVLPRFGVISNLNEQPGGPLQLSDVSGSKVPAFQALGDVITINRSLSGAPLLFDSPLEVFEDGLKTPGGEAWPARFRLQTAAGPVYTDRLVWSTGPGAPSLPNLAGRNNAPNWEERVDRDPRVRTATGSARAAAESETPYAPYVDKVVIVVGTGDSAKVEIERLLRLPTAPEEGFKGDVAGVGYVDKIFWVGATQQDCRKLILNLRTRYGDIAAGIKNLVIEPVPGRMSALRLPTGKVVIEVAPGAAEGGEATTVAASTRRALEVGEAVEITRRQPRLLAGERGTVQRLGPLNAEVLVRSRGEVYEVPLAELQRPGPPLAAGEVIEVLEEFRIGSEVVPVGSRLPVKNVVRRRGGLLLRVRVTTPEGNPASLQRGSFLSVSPDAGKAGPPRPVEASGRRARRENPSAPPPLEPGEVVELKQALDARAPAGSRAVVEQIEGSQVILRLNGRTFQTQRGDVQRPGPEVAPGRDAVLAQELVRGSRVRYPAGTRVRVLELEGGGPSPGGRIRTADGAESLVAAGSLFTVSPDGSPLETRRTLRADRLILATGFRSKLPELIRRGLGLGERNAERLEVRGVIGEQEPGQAREARIANVYAVEGPSAERERGRGVVEPGRGLDRAALSDPRAPLPPGVYVIGAAAEELVSEEETRGVPENSKSIALLGPRTVSFVRRLLGIQPAAASILPPPPQRVELPPAFDLGEGELRFKRDGPETRSVATIRGVPEVLDTRAVRPEVEDLLLEAELGELLRRRLRLPAGIRALELELSLNASESVVLEAPAGLETASLQSVRATLSQAPDVVVRLRRVLGAGTLLGARNRIGLELTVDGDRVELQRMDVRVDRSIPRTDRRAERERRRGRGASELLDEEVRRRLKRRSAEERRRRGRG